ncbi:trimethylguanosine synthase isoform X2 [Coccinella septempunctata]|uniref:trimethylguanosine synthase isoform X2 n=1 Tax=Coccinella septempunctata TaxID=41139 RepID=UPI001D096DDC|nr:trimethylguanosine synthase isoform X2 [Coccinella septempunctata]
MCESQWNTLAVITLQKQSSFNEIHCVCSRLFVRYKAEEDQSPEDSAVEDTSENITFQAVKVKSDVENEPLSCYCSASHTDTFSTDEHDSLRETSEGRPLLSNDCGTDAIISGKQDIFLEWQKFWSVNGEKLIWESWITKYSDYINPEFLGYYAESNAQTITDSNIKSEISKAQLTKFSFDDGQKNNTKVFQRELSENDDTVNNDISEGWNPLSPQSNDGDTENEQLLRPRCSSHAGSSVRTVDSMTNVTRMTVSSIDFNKSPSDSLSSVSSVESSVSTTSSSEGDEDNGNEWNHLWKIHYEQEYLIQYNQFLADRDYSNTLESIPKSLKHCGQHNLLTKQKTAQTKIEFSTEKNGLENKFSNLEMNNDSTEKSDLSDKEELVSEETKQMIALGLPAAFGKLDECFIDSTRKSEGLTTNKDNLNSSRNKIKAAFNLLGIEFTEKKDELMSGKVDYKMKHIRSQNRLLKLRGVKRKHTYFDDDGNPISENTDEENNQSILSDHSEVKVSSGDEEDITTSEQTIIQKDEPDVCLSKRRKRRKRINIPPEIRKNSKLKKYWIRRFSLFSRFDEGIKLDEESWYSVTPELVAKNTAERCRTDVIVDGFCGAGGNAIQFAFTCKKVIAIDIDPKKIELAKNNAQVYGVLDRIEFIVGDYISLASSLKADIVFLSPPWGGPSYVRQKTYDLESMLEPVPFSKLMEESRKISRNVAVFLPKNSNTYDVMKYAGEDGFVEIEQNFINNNLIGITVYYNDLVKKT